VARGSLAPAVVLPADADYHPLRVRRLACTLLMALLPLGCGEVLLPGEDAAVSDSGRDAGPGADGAVPDSGGARDAGPPDAAPEDGGPEDGGTADSGAADSGVEDVGPDDSGAEDAAPGDSGTEDAAPEDAGTADAGAADAGFEDAAPADVGFPDVGFPDVGFPDAGLYTVTLSPSGPGTLAVPGAGVTCPGQCALTVPAGASITVQATPDPQGRLDAWLSPAACVGQGGSCTITVQAALTVSVAFELVQHDLEVRMAGGATGTGVVLAAPSLSCPGSCIASYPAGTMVTLEAHGDPGSRLKRWLGDCTGSVRTCSVTMSQGRLVFAEFESVPQLVSNGQAASLVLGQVDFTSSARPASPTSANMDLPESCASDGTRLFVADSYQNRILGWSTLPGLSGQAADTILGQTSATGTSGTSDPAAATSAPSRIWLGGGRLYASVASRVMIWDQLPFGYGDPASRLLGQASWTSSGGALTADRFYGAPSAVVEAGNQLVVLDPFAGRALIWDPRPTGSGLIPANRVLGQVDFVSRVSSLPPTASSLGDPRGLAFHPPSGRLAIAQPLSNRVMIWSQMPAQNNQPADVIVGQTQASGRLPNAGLGGPNAVGFNTPAGVAFTSDSLIVVDEGNSRVMFWTPIPTQSGAPATAVLGVPDLTQGWSGSASASRFSIPRGVCVAGNKLFVVDFAANRVLRFDLARP
jgi:hypothetical protein